MEKPSDQRSKNSGLLRFLAKSTSFSIPRHRYNPPRERNYFNKAFLGPIVSIIPAEAWPREKIGDPDQAEEPVSPKVSCIGQIKGKKESSEHKRRPSPPTVQEQKKKKKKRPSFLLCGRALDERAKEKVQRSGAAAAAAGGGAPRIGEMRRFASMRETAGYHFDWKKKGENSAYDHEEYCKDDVHHEVIIAYSAPLMVGGGDRVAAPQPRKEVNIWKRRTMAPPSPLQL